MKAKIMKWTYIAITGLIIVGCMVSVPSYMSYNEPIKSITKNKDTERKAEEPKPAVTPAPSESGIMFPKRSPASVPNESARKENPNKVDNVTSQLYSASMAFSVPEKANIKEDITIQLMIDPSKELKELEKSLSEPGRKSSASVKVSQVVIATLTAPDFDVQNVTPEEQAIAQTQRTEWLWTLTPKSIGKNEVKLSITAVVKLDGKDYKYHIKTYEKTILIEIKPQQRLEEWIAKYWQWLFSTLILPLGLWLYKRQKKE